MSDRRELFALQYVRNNLYTVEHELEEAFFAGWDACEEEYKNQMSRIKEKVTELEKTSKLNPRDFRIVEDEAQ